MQVHDAAGDMGRVGAWMKTMQECGRDGKIGWTR